MPKVIEKGYLIKAKDETGETQYIKPNFTGMFVRLANAERCIRIYKKHYGFTDWEVVKVKLIECEEV